MLTRILLLELELAEYKSMLCDAANLTEIGDIEDELEHLYSIYDKET